MTPFHRRLAALAGGAVLAGAATLVYVLPWTVPPLVRIPLSWGLLIALLFNEIALRERPPWS